MNNLQEIVALWDKYHYSIATDAMEYDRELRQLLFANSNVCDVSDVNIEELISKRQAIDASIEAVNSWNKSCSIGQQKRIENYIKQLPSAQPIIRCKDCRYYNSEEKECLDLLGYGRRWEEDDFCSYGAKMEVTT